LAALGFLLFADPRRVIGQAFLLDRAR